MLMPTNPPQGPAPSRQPRVALAALTLGVLLAHAALLHGAPLASSLGTAADRPFVTRTITLATEPATAPTRPALPAPQHRPSGRTAVFSDLERNSDLAPVQLAPAATENIAAQSTPAAPATLLAAAKTGSAAIDALASTSPPPPIAQPIRHLAVPSPIRLKYTINGEVKGFPYVVNGELQWQQDGKTYDARLEVSHFLLGSRVQTSRGDLTPQGLAPVRFGDKVRSEVAAHFERAKGKVSFSANTPDVPLQSGAQDQLSIFMQLASILGGEPEQFPAGSRLAFQAVGPRNSEQWVFAVGDTETLTLPGGAIKTLKLSRDPSAEFDSKADVWLAPEFGYMPVRIRLTQANGDFADQLWQSTVKP
jgi:hypothetical protein